MQASCAADLMGLLAILCIASSRSMISMLCVDVSRASICCRLYASWPLQSQPLNHCDGSLWFALERAPLNASGTPIGRAGDNSRGYLTGSCTLSTSSLKLQCTAFTPAVRCNNGYLGRMKRHTSSLPCAIDHGRSRFVAQLALQQLPANEKLYRVRLEPRVTTANCMVEACEMYDRTVKVQCS
ncbi:hypothetical protein C7974DRAFT_78200 [Boeremia exigua]|uniref:uncharacterized protein n=1 Tax=Boeremia exigua TaxID=749465 RepID=UPI001E8E381A|nr:uncharacterized protein C7974DRAFT_78200 [Boeremia exigua]KAH6612467.1 hypothetical protein C7974DRAFT_78200 [Boeremia exigua]